VSKQLSSQQLHTGADDTLVWLLWYGRASSFAYHFRTKNSVCAYADWKTAFSGI